MLSIDRIRFGDFEFDRLNRLLYRDGAELSLPPRAVGVLSCLIERPGQIVPKQVLLDEVWKDANVTETSLTEAVSLLRQALVDDAQRPTFIQTVPRRGYRFVATALPANAPAADTYGTAAAPAAAPPVAGEPNVSGARVAHPSGVTAAGMAVAGVAAPGVAASSVAAPGVAATGVAATGVTAAGVAAAGVVAPGVTGHTGHIGMAGTSAREADAIGLSAGDAGSLAYEAAWPAWLPWLFVVVMIGVMAGIILAVIRQPSSYARPVVRFGVELPAGVELARDGAALALSRDGRRVAFVARGIGGSSAPRIYVRDTDRLDPVVLEGTDGASSPFFSPDARWIGFFAGGALKKVPAAGGTIVRLCEARAPLGAVWSTRRFIVFASSLTGGLSRVHEDGGTPAVLTTPDAATGDVRHAWPDLLPGDTGIVFAGLPLTGGPEASRVEVLSFDTGRVQTLVEAATSPHVAPTGHLLFGRDRAVFAAPFDPETLEILGQAVPVLDDVATADAADTNAVSQFAVTPGGHTAAIRLTNPESAATYRWVRVSDATAVPAAPAFVPFPAREIRWLSLSPDGTRLVIARGDGHRSEIWTSDATGGGLQRVTSDGQNVAPIWSADGRRVIYASRQDGPFSLFAKVAGEAAAAALPIRAVPHARAPAPSTSSASSARAAAAHQQFPASVSADGLVYVDVDADSPQPRTGLDLWFLPWSGGAAQPLVRTAADETSGVMSPDGRWLAYQSNGSGAWMAMIAAREGSGATPHAGPLPASPHPNAHKPRVGPAGGARERAEPVVVANTDGARLAWSPDGRYLLFTRDGQLWQARVTLDGPAPGVGAPRMLAADVDAAGGLGVAPDGRVLIRTREAAATSQTRLELVLDWSRELNAKVPIRPRPTRTVR